MIDIILAGEYELYGRDQFDMGKIVSLMILRERREIGFEDAAYLLFLMDKFNFDYNMYQEAIKQTNFNP